MKLLKLVDVVRGINLDLFQTSEQCGMGIACQARNEGNLYGREPLQFKIFVNLLSSVLRTQTKPRLLKKSVQ